MQQSADHGLETWKRKDYWLTISKNATGISNKQLNSID